MSRRTHTAVEGQKLQQATRGFAQILEGRYAGLPLLNRVNCMDARKETYGVLNLAKRFIGQKIEMGEDEFVFKEKIWSDPVSNKKLLHDFYLEIKDCQRCRLGATRTNFVFGVGDPEADILFIGEAPGRDEDLQGEPFVGRAGQLLTKIIESLKLKREDVYIANMLKCRPPNNRDPQTDEVEMCRSYLDRQIEIIQPNVICALGRIAAQALLSTSMSLTALRGKMHHYKGAKVIVTYHPAALLRNPQWKKPTWEDMKMLRREYDGVEL